MMQTEDPSTFPQGPGHITRNQLLVYMNEVQTSLSKAINRRSYMISAPWFNMFNSRCMESHMSDNLEEIVVIEPIDNSNLV